MMQTVVDPESGLTITIPYGAEVLNGRVVGMNNKDMGPVESFEVDYSTSGTPTPDRTWGDVQRQNRQNAKELGIQTGIGAAGALAQLATQAVPTAADARNNERLAALTEAESKGTLGLDAAGRQQAESDLLNPARAEVAQRAAVTGQRLASMGNTSLSAQKAMEAADAQAAQAGLVRAGAEINRANIAARAAQEREMEERTQYKANRQSAMLDQVSNAIGDLAYLGGKVAAAQASRSMPTSAELKTWAADKPHLAGMTDAQLYDAYNAEQKYQKARAREPYDVRIVPSYRQSASVVPDDFTLTGTVTPDLSE